MFLEPHIIYRNSDTAVRCLPFSGIRIDLAILNALLNENHNSVNVSTHKLNKTFALFIHLMIMQGEFH